MILETRRLHLREMSMKDLDFIAGMMSDPNVMKYYPEQLTRQESENWIIRHVDRYRKDGHGLWLVEDIESGTKIGQVGLVMQQAESENLAEIGYLIHYPYWHKGYATEAALGVKKYAFENLDYEQVISLIRPENTPSQGVAKKLGMKAQKQIKIKGYDHRVFMVSKVI
jgi:ribosomal-protein-alanine N-acetyltransferase